MLLLHEIERLGYARRLIHILKNQDTDINYEIIAVDDTDCSPSIPGVNLIKTDLCGPAEARNTGWQNAEGEIVIFIDTDCVPGENWLNDMLTPFNSEIQNLGGVGCAYWTLNPEYVVAWCIGEEIAYRHSKQGRIVQYLGTYSVAYRRSVLEDVGGFDESFLRANSEDNDLSYRVRNAGYNLLFLPDVAVGHPHPHQLFKYLKQQSSRAYWRTLLYKKHKDRLSGDQYSSIVDFVQAPLSLVPMFGHIAIMLFQLKEAYHIYMKNNRDPRALNIIPLNALRGYAWAHGLIKGFLEFGFI